MPDDDLFEDDDEFVEINSQFCRKPNDSSNTPGDPLLRYKEPLYKPEKLSKILPGYEGKYTAIVVCERLTFCFTTLTQASFRV
jgi:hypothetical protein